MNQTKIGLQLYSVRGECSNDLAATLKAVAGIGYVGVEPYGYAGDSLSWLGHGAKDIRKMLDDCGLICCGIHLRTDALVGDNLKRSIEFNEILGNHFLIIAADGTRMKTQEGIADLATILNDAVPVLEKWGMTPGYHAHGFDAAEIDGVPAWFRLFDQVLPGVIMQMDVGNYFSGDGDPIAAMKRFPNRARTVHVKDRNAPEPGRIGQGEAPVAEFLELCQSLHKTEWYVVEECAPEGLGFDVVTTAYTALENLLREQ